MNANIASARNSEIQRLVDQALEDQRSSWDRGERITVETLIERAPALRHDGEAMLDLIYQEYVLRREHREGPQPAEFYGRFPDFAGVLAFQFGVDAAIEPSTEPENERDPSSNGADEPLEDIAGYEIIGELGRGGMGVVYQARDLKLGRVVAIKTIADGRRATAEQRERFRAEAQAVARLRHPSIVAIHAIGEHDGQPYLSLEFAAGGSLAQRLLEKPMAPRDAAELLETLARAVHAAHQAGVVHRDLKPSNVLYTADGVPKVSDFGLAKLTDADSVRTLSGQPLGTPSYMAPEQAAGRGKEAGPAADTYSLGAILYHSLTGRPPFLGESVLETMKLVESTEAVFPRLLRPDVPRDLETICLKCLEKEPLRRFASALELADDLRRFLDCRPIMARPVGMMGRLGRWGRRNPWVAGLSAGVFASLILGMGASATLMFRAIRAEAATRKQRDQAELEANRFKAVIEFLRKDMLAQASVGNQPTRDATPDPDLKVRTALDRAAATIGNRFAEQPLVEASIRQTIGETYHQIGLFSQARPHLERAIELRRGALGAENPETFSAMHSLGVLLDDDGKWPEAERYLVPAMDGLRKTRGIDDLETLEAMADVGNLYNQLERTNEAELMLSQTVDGLRRTRGDRGILTLRTMDDLATVYLAQKKPGQAEQLEEDVVRGLREEAGTDNPYTLGARRNLAATYEANGKSAQAEPLLKTVLKDQRRVLGDKHPDTLLTMAVLAEHYMKHGKMDQVEKYADEAIVGSRSVLNDKHQVRAAALSFLAVVYGSRGDLTKLESVMIEAVELARFRWGPDSDVTAQGDADVGQILIFLGKYSQAEPYCREDAAFRIKHSPVHSERFLAELRLGVCLLAQKKYTEARLRLLSAYNGMKPREKDALPTDTSDLGRIIEHINQVRDDAGKPLYDASLAKLRSDPVLKAVVFDLPFPADPFAR